MLGQVKCIEMASSRAEAESWGSLAVWPLFPMGETVSCERTEHAVSELVVESTRMGHTVRSEAPHLFVGEATNGGGDRKRVV